MSMTHAIYAKKIAEHINLKYKIKLKKYNLIYGSVKPDVSLFFSKYPHYINESLNKLCDTVDVLIESTDNENEIETRAFSRELGVILHYVTDYFCRAHNDINGRKHPTNYKHIAYEQQFQNKLEIYELDEIREKISNSLDDDINKITKDSLESYIKKMHYKYMKKAGKTLLYNNHIKNRKTDMEYSFGMSLLIASYIVNKIIEKKGI